MELCVLGLVQPLFLKGTWSLARRAVARCVVYLCLPALRLQAQGQCVRLARIAREFILVECFGAGHVCRLGRGGQKGSYLDSAVSCRRAHRSGGSPIRCRQQRSLCFWARLQRSLTRTSKRLQSHAACTSRFTSARDGGMDSVNWKRALWTVFFTCLIWTHIRL